jgi:hypothetical protein
MSQYLYRPTRTMVEVIRDRHLEREAAGDRTREHVERGLLLAEVDKLQRELNERPGFVTLVAPVLALSLCFGVWGAALAWVVR